MPNCKWKGLIYNIVLGFWLLETDAPIKILINGVLRIMTFWNRNLAFKKWNVRIIIVIIVRNTEGTMYYLQGGLFLSVLNLFSLQKNEQKQKKKFYTLVPYQDYDCYKIFGYSLLSCADLSSCFLFICFVLYF